MSDLVIIAAIIISVFFAAGVVLGVTSMISLSVTGRRRPDIGWPRYGQAARRPRPPRAWAPEPADEIGYDETGYDDDDTRPHWPEAGYRS